MTVAKAKCARRIRKGGPKAAPRQPIYSGTHTAETSRRAFVDWRPRRSKRTEGLTTRRLYHNGPAR